MKPLPGLRLFDTHCHLHDESFDADRKWVVRRARLKGVVRVLTVAEDLDDAHRLLQVADRHPGFIVPALGIHPDRAPLVSDGEVAAMEALIRKHATALGAVGEVGLDHRPRWDERARARQEEVFVHMIRLAEELELPLTIHSRGAGKHAIACLEREGRTAVAVERANSARGNCTRRSA